jgi:Ca2+-transporting ATPase
MAAGVLAVHAYASARGGEAYARTAAFTALAAFQWFQALNARSCCRSIFRVGLFGNRWLLAGIGTAVVLQLGAIYTRAGQAIFGTVELSPGDWLICLAAASSILVVDEIFKAFKLHGSSGGG